MKNLFIGVIKPVFITLLLKLIFFHPLILDSSFFGKLMKIPFLLLAGHIDYDSIMKDKQEEYLASFEKGLNSLNRRIQKESVKILDLGAGTGAASLRLADFFPEAEVTALDASKEMLKKAENKAVRSGYSNLNFVKGDIYDLPFAENNFDLLTASNAPVSLSQARRVMKKNSYLLISLSQAGEHLCSRREKLQQIARSFEFTLISIGNTDGGGIYILLAPVDK